MLIVGLISGTSVDGIDAAVVDIQGRPGEYSWSLRAYECVPWPDAVRQAILDSCRPDAPVQQVVALNAVIGEEFAGAALTVIAAAGLQPAEIDAIASHGQTIWHQPQAIQAGERWGRGTLQLGEPAVIAARTGCMVVSGFRAADMALGGQGAPFAPFADYALFRSTTVPRAVQNIGGIGNVTYLPANCSSAEIVAFDTGPGNMVIDAVVRHLSHGTLAYDAGGEWAARGQISLPLLMWGMEHPFLHETPPKSTGREEFGPAFVARFLAEAERVECRNADLVATATALTAESIYMAYRRWLLPIEGLETLIVCGGGAHNATLCEMIDHRFGPPARIVRCDELGMPADAKEAILFALLGYETLHGRPCTLPAATGALSAAVSGAITLPPAGAARFKIPLDSR